MEIRKAVDNMLKALESQQMTAKPHAMEILVDSMRCAREWILTPDDPVPYMADSSGEVDAHDD